VRKIIHDKSRGVLIVPHWRSMPGWLEICQDGVHANNVFTSVWKFWPFYQKGPDAISPTFEGQPKFATLCLIFNGPCNRPSNSKIQPNFCLETDCRFCLPF
jgi:hypothetical protein